MSARIRVTPTVVPHSFQQTTSTSDDANLKLTFGPVSEGVITRIMGKVALGLPEIGVDQAAAPSYIYRWHVWLSRMNDWMRENRKVYPKFMHLPSVRVPATLHFLENIPSRDEKTANAATAPLGPLSPVEFNTFLHSLRKGIEQCGASYEKDYDVETLTKFLREVNKMATFAVEPHGFNKQLRSTKPVLTDKETGQLRLDEGLDAVPPAAPVVMMSDTASSIPILGHIVEHFIGRKRGTLFASLPLWTWVVMLMVIIYLFVGNNNKDGNREFIGGGCNSSVAPPPIQKVISISDFHVPR